VGVWVMGVGVGVGGGCAGVRVAAVVQPVFGYCWPVNSHYIYDEALGKHFKVAI